MDRTLIRRCSTFARAAVPLWMFVSAGQGQTGPTITQQPVGQTNSTGSKVTLSVGVAGKGPFTYRWVVNGTNLPRIITTVAGVGLEGYSGDGGPAINAFLGEPLGAAADGTGDLYLADTQNSVVRRVNTNGIITTVAGDGIADFFGDGGPATDAELYYPSGVAVDFLGNIFIADTGNNLVRKVDGNGVISTVAGDGGWGYTGDGGAATNAWLEAPVGVAVDAGGNLFIADSYNNAVRKVTPAGIITTAAGNGTAGFGGESAMATNACLNYPYAVSADPAGNLFVADVKNNRIRKVDAGGFITTVAGNGAGAYTGDGGPATSASINGPSGVAADGSGGFFIMDRNNLRVRKVDAAGVITTVAGNGLIGESGDGGEATNAAIYFPVAITLSGGGDLLIVSQDSLVRKVSMNNAPRLEIDNVSLANSGNYQVVISNSQGSVTSVVARVTVIPLARPNMRLEMVSGLPSLTVTGQPGTSYRIQYCGELATLAWTTLIGFTLSGYSLTITDSQAAGSTRYYRAVSP